MLNRRLRLIYILKSVRECEPILCSLNAQAGTGKSHTNNTLLSHFRSESKIALAAASSDIANTLFEGGRTAHSTFSIKILCTKNCYCYINVNSDKAKLRG